MRIRNATTILGMAVLAVTMPDTAAAGKEFACGPEKAAQPTVTISATNPDEVRASGGWTCCDPSEPASCPWHEEDAGSPFSTPSILQAAETTVMLIETGLPTSSTPSNTQTPPSKVPRKERVAHTNEQPRNTDLSDEKAAEPQSGDANNEGTTARFPTPPDANPRHFVQLSALTEAANVEPTVKHLTREYPIIQKETEGLFTQEHPINDSEWHLVLADAGSPESRDRVCQAIRDKGGGCFPATRTLAGSD